MNLASECLMKRWLLVFPGVPAVASLVAWAFAYSSMDCYAALPRASSWPPRLPWAAGFGGFGCSRLLDDISLIAVLLGWMAPVAALGITPLIGLARERKAPR